MKAIYIVLLITLSLSADHVRWFFDYEEAHKEALKQNKHLMVLLVEDSVITKETIKNTFMDQPYIDEINREFIPVLVAKGRKESYPIEMLYTLIYPTLFFLDKYELYSCNPIRGQITPQAVKEHLLKCK